MTESSRGAPFGNNYAAKGRVWSDCLRRAISQDDGKRVRGAIEKLLDLAESGEPWAIKELADRLDGKSVQAHSAPDGGDLTITHIIRQIIDPIDPT